MAVQLINVACVQHVIGGGGGGGGFNTVENTKAFLYSDWLYFLWHGIKMLVCTAHPSVISYCCIVL